MYIYIYTCIHSLLSEDVRSEFELLQRLSVPCSLNPLSPKTLSPLRPSDPHPGTMSRFRV